MNYLFKSLSFAQITGMFPTQEELDAYFEEFALKPPSSLEIESIGFLPVNEMSHYAVRTLNGSVFFKVGLHKKILPVKFIKEEARRRNALVEELTGSKATSKNLRDLEKDILHEYLPQAVYTTDETTVAWLPDLKLIAISTTSKSKIKKIISLIRRSIAPDYLIDATLISSRVSAEGFLQRVFINELDEESLDYGTGYNLTIESGVELQDMENKKHILKASFHEFDQENKDLLEAQGMEVKKIEMCLHKNNKDSAFCFFTMNSKMVINKMAYSEDQFREISLDLAQSMIEAQELQIMADWIKAIYEFFDKALSIPKMYLATEEIEDLT